MTRGEMAMERGRRIVFVNRYYDPDQSATSRMLTDLAASLAARGLCVHVVCSRQLYDDAAMRLPPEEMRREVRIHRVATTRFGRNRLVGRALDYASFYATCAFTLLRVLNRGAVLIAMTDPPLLSILAAPIALATRSRLVNWQQDVFPEVASRLGANPLPGWVDWAVKRLRDASLRAAAMNVLIGYRMRDYIAGRGVQDFRLCVIENWADGEAIQPKEPTAGALRSRLDLAGRFVIGYSGNLGRAHEFDTLLAAAAALQAEPAYVFLMIGGGAKMESLKRAVAQRGLESFRFLPYQPQDALEDSLAAADVHLVSLLPALEGLIVPSKLYGILAGGRPVIFIGDPDGDVGRVIERVQCGRRVEVGDSTALVAAIRALKTDPSLRAGMGERARQAFCEEFNLRQAVDRWAAVIEKA
jgi:glycosyltransferase involved in cell wall biosynthesis